MISVQLCGFIFGAACNRAMHGLHCQLISVLIIGTCTYSTWEKFVHKPRSGEVHVAVSLKSMLPYSLSIEHILYVYAWILNAVEM